MGMIVGHNTYYIECDDPHARGCRQKTEAANNRRQAEVIALFAGWSSNNTEKWWCNSCRAYIPPSPPLRLTKENWWSELGETNLPQDLAALLRNLIGATLNSAIRPGATKPLVELAKKHLSGGIWINDMFYTVMVCEPFDVTNSRRIFMLVSTYPNCTLRRLEEI